MMTPNSKLHLTKVNLGYFDAHVDTRSPEEVSFGDFNSNVR